MKVCIALLRNPIHSISGDAEDVRLLSSKLQQSGVDVIVLSCKNNPHVSRKSNFVPTYPIRFYQQRKWFDLSAPFSFYRFVKTLRSISNEVDIIQCHYPTPSFAFLSDFICYKNSTPVITNLGGASISETKSIIQHMRGSYKHYLSRILINNKYFIKISKFRCNKYIVSSEYQKNLLKSFGIKPNIVKVIPNAVDASRNVEFKKESSKEKLDLKDKYVISYIGHFTHNKGVEFLVSAFSEILKTSPNSKLVLAWSGTGSREKIITKIEKEGIQDKVLILHKIDVSLLLSATDVLVLPYVLTIGTHWFPHTLLEALSVGVPIVTSRFEIMQEVIEHGKTGLLVEPANPKQIAESIIILLSDEKLRNNMVKEQRKVAKEKFDSEKVAQQYIDLYKEVLNG